MGIQIRMNIQRPIEVVFPFALDVARLPLYDKNIREVKKITEGPIGVGTTFHLAVSQFGIRMVAVLVFTAYEPASHHFAYRVISGPFPVETRYTFESLEGDTQLTAEREPQPRGIWKGLIPLINAPARKKFETELNNLKNYLEAKP